jgi:hypothetical protein
MAEQLKCPHCRQTLTFNAPVPVGHKVRCTACGKPFVNAGMTALAAAANDVPVAAPYTPPPPSSVPVVPVISGPRPRRTAALPALGALAVLLLGAAFLFFLNPFAGDREENLPKGKEIAQLPEVKEPPPSPPTVPEPQPPVVEKKSPVVEPKVVGQKKPPAGTKKAAVEVVKQSPPEKKDSVVAPKKSSPQAVKKPSSAPELQKKIDEAVARGIAYLNSPQARPDSWCAKIHPVGYSSLVGLTLLECGFPADDRLVRAAAEEVRSRVQANDYTYDVSLALLFLDRLGDSGDKKLIQQLAMRLVASQNTAGGWSYPCPKENEAFAQELFEVLQADRAHGRLKKEKGATQAGTPPAVPERFRRLAIFQTKEGGPLGNAPGQFGDNSNTQFALLALWAARRHGIPLGRTFALAERRFRETQHLDGGWAYMGMIGARSVLTASSSKSMTCVGLLGLAIGRGSEYELLHLDKSGPGDAVKKLTNQDVGIVRGLKRLGLFVGTPTGRTAGLPLENLYFLWSVERVAVLYDLSTIGDKDWYRWGVEILLSNQQPDGRWWEKGNSMTDPSVDTCFALLFLNRTNLVPDLSRNLRLFVPIVDPDRKSGTP